MTSMTGTAFDMRNPWKVDIRIKKCLEGSFFYPLIEMVPYTQKTILQSFIKDCYDKSSRTFTFGRDGQIRLYLGLQDVFAISGFPVDGSRLVICEDVETKEICIKMLGTHEEGGMKMKVSKQWLKEKFEAVPEGISDNDLAPYVRGYLMYLIGTKVLPNCDKPQYYPAYWLQFLDDLSPSKLNDVAWGAAALAMLHANLSGNRENVKGPMWIAEFFFLERIPKIANLIIPNGSSEETTKTVPLFSYWSPLMVDPGKDTGKLKMEAFEFIRDRMTIEDVKLAPYVDYQGYLHKRIFFSRVVLFNFNKIIYHEPENGFLQLGIINLKEVERLDVLVPKSSGGTTKRKIMKAYRPYIERWKNRHLEKNCINGDGEFFSLPSVPAKDDSDEYFSPLDDEGEGETNDDDQKDGSPVNDEVPYPFNDQNNGAPPLFNDVNPVNNEVLEPHADQSGFFDTDEILNDASSSRNDDSVGSNVAPPATVQRRPIKSRKDLQVNIGGNRKILSPNTPLSPSSVKKKRKAKQKQDKPKKPKDK